MAPRSNWKGYLKLSLVSAAVAIYPATSSTERVRFNMLNRDTGNRLKRQMVDAATGKEVDSESQVRGFAVGKDTYVIVEDEELESVALESTHTINIEKFVPKATIDDRYRDTAYYIAPEDQVGLEAFAVIRDGMKSKKMVGIARLVMARRERIMMIEPFGKGLLGTTLHYAYEIRSEDAAFEDIPDLDLPKQMVGLAEDIIDKMSGMFDPTEFEDRYEQAMVALIKTKQTGKPVKSEKAPSQPANVVNLMDALRRSIEGKGKGKTKGGDRDKPKPPPKRRARG